MPIRVPLLRRFPLALFLAVVAGASSPAFSQTLSSVSSAEPVTIVPEARPAASLNGLMREGTSLESNQRWGEALNHYEEALRDYPKNDSLLQRHDLAKLHYSLDRRLRDQSFRKSVKTLSSRQALSLYSELLRKINTHYVVNPAWRQIGVRGITALEVALRDRNFRTANGLQISTDQMALLRRELYQLIARQGANSPSDLVALAGEAARLTEARTGLGQTAAVLEFVTAAAGGLDNYSGFLTPNQLRDVYSQIEGNFVGLGVELKADNGALLIVHVIPGSPAKRAGILADDRIVAVNGTPTADLSTDEAAALLTGKEGSWVRVTVLTGGQQARVLNIRREHVEVPSLEDVKIIDADLGVAYVRVPSFQKATSRDLESALWKLHREGMKALILDLRGNPGGLLTSSVEMADKFLTRGNIVSTRGRSPQEDFNYQANYGGTWRVPLVVLIDGDSASASEIFAGAIKENGRGTIVGTTSYGKGTVQGIFPLGYAGAGIRLTTAKFFSPNGKPISKHGIEPNEKMPQYVAKPVIGSQAKRAQQAIDPVLQAGIEAVRIRMAAR